MELPGQNINDRFIGFYKFILQALDISKHGVSLLDASNVSLQLFSDVQKSNGLLISRFSPANPFARLIEAEITNKNPELFPSDLYLLNLPRSDLTPEQVVGLSSYLARPLVWA